MTSNKSDPPAYVDYPGASGVWSEHGGPSHNQPGGSINEVYADTDSIIRANDRPTVQPSAPVQSDDVWNSRNDIFKTMDYKQADFEDIVKQPTSPLTIPGINVFFSFVFTYTQAVLYTMLTLITGVFVTLAWGLIFAIISYTNVWIIKPSLRLIMDIVTPFGQLYRFILRMFMDPVFESIGQMYAYLRGHLKLSVSGISRDTVIQNV